MTARDLCGRDPLESIRCNAALLRASRFHQADIQPTAQEIEDMSQRDKRRLKSGSRVPVTDLRQWKHQRVSRPQSWQGGIDALRDEIDRVFRPAPGLRNGVAGAVPRVYAGAVRDAGQETKIARASFPASCPFSLDQIRNEEFFPE